MGWPGPMDCGAPASLNKNLCFQMLQDLPRKGPRCWLFWCTVPSRSGCVLALREEWVGQESMPKPLDNCRVGRYTAGSCKLPKDPFWHRSYFGRSNAWSSGLTFPLHRFCRTVGSPHHQPGRGLWDHCRGNLLDGGVRR